ncbi:PspC domain-containing protein [Corynebacterium liangguodongii]|uniref:Uncharacterized protein n=1 Tax=Corynebacterium liangguodongii TaxID=2079535 RepID=A0A2S0WCM6_9CORY|nr:PspC domain-containing protein [Corynebacterium liangguodongii]AWB83432.1 hypothetical protein C3E79_02110 [Corynebacterium liangguodongii]PWC00478.1 PspC domain-containing protein [Corynebacterium liangguodongii]
MNTTLQDIWSTRPVRIPKDQGGNAAIAGVCEGIGARYRIDPVVVRIAFVALTLVYGGGLFLYLLMWLNMPRFGMDTSPWRAINAPKGSLDAHQKKDRETGWWLLVGLVILLPSISAGAGGAAASSLVTFALAGIALYLLHNAHPVPPAGLGARPGEGTVTEEADTSHLTAPEGYPHPGVGSPRPPKWDPLGTVPELWHLPDPSEEPAPAPASRGRTGALVALGTVAVAIAVFASGARLISVDHSDDTFTITDNLDGSYNSGIGTASFDFSDMAPLTEDKTVTIDHGIGKVTITAPRDTRVMFSCDEGIGEHNCPPVLNDASPGPTLTLDVNVGIGEISVVSP